MIPLKFDDPRYLVQPVPTSEEQELMLARFFHWSSVVTTAFSRTSRRVFGSHTAANRLVSSNFQFT